MKFSTRGLAFIVLLFATLFALGVSIERGYRNTGKVEPDKWPPGLAELAKANSISTARVDVRYGGEYLSTLWKMPATEAVVADHIRIFKLQAVSNDGSELDRVRYRLPYPWRWPKKKNLICYAQPVGNQTIAFDETQVIIVHNKSDQELIGYHYRRLY